MAQYQVPQYIEVQEKIVGPLTLKQFFYLAGAAVISFICFYIFNFIFWILISVIAFAIAASFAFLKINGRPLPKVIFSAFNFYWRPHLYIWQRKPTMEEVKIPELKQKVSAQDKLKDLSKRLLTSREPIPKREGPRSVSDKFTAMRKISGETKVAKRVDYR